MAPKSTITRVHQSDQKNPPENFLEIKRRIVSGHGTFSEDGKRLVKAALDDPAAIAFGTVASVACKCSVSMTTVTRTARVLGFSGFRDLRAVFRTYLKRPAS
ncbi:DNA-binding MurR/RpiR family transcriptional regulator [Shinella sp. BE166]|uniref:MurR/RpiR family transcriptional regulator n=1 Tax=Shinella sp. BE166 TaxID=3373918 RepID=UPI003EBD273A